MARLELLRQGGRGCIREWGRRKETIKYTSLKQTWPELAVLNINAIIEAIKQQMLRRDLFEICI